MTFRIVLTRMILERLDAIVVDIDNALLNGDLDHEIFMKMPEGYKECIQDYNDGKALKLDKAIFGLVLVAQTQKQDLNEVLWIHVYFDTMITED